MYAYSSLSTLSPACQGLSEILIETPPAHSDNQYSTGALLTHAPMMPHNREVRGTDPHHSPPLMKTAILTTCALSVMIGFGMAMGNAGLIDVSAIEAQTTEIQERCGETNPILAQRQARWGHCD